MKNPQLSLSPSTSVTVIGGGKWGRIHAHNIFKATSNEDADGIHPIAVTTGNDERRKAFSEAMNMTTHQAEFQDIIYNKPDEIPDEKIQKTDLFIVAVVPEAVEKVLLGEDGASGLLSQSQNKTFLIEKPIAATREAAEKIISVANSYGHQLIMTNQTRYASLWLRLLDEVGDDFEAIESIVVKRKFKAPSDGPSTKYGGVAQNLGIHSLEELHYALSKWGINPSEIKNQKGMQSDEAEGVHHTAQIDMSVRNVPVTVEVSQASEGRQDYTEIKMVNGDIFRFTEEDGGKKILQKNDDKLVSASGENTVLLQLIDVFRHVDEVLLNDLDTPRIIPTKELEHQR